jgi:hypothetical protein
MKSIGDETEVIAGRCQSDQVSKPEGFKGRRDVCYRQ